MSSAARVPATVEPAGVTLARARERRARIDRLRCDLHLAIPRHSAEPIAGTITLAFDLTGSPAPLVVDFAPAATHLRRTVANGEPADPRIENGHVIIQADRLARGANQLSFDFVAGDGPLNRREGLLYSLFVPARASHAFPCFDQPDLKGRWRVSLEIPGDWHAVANGAEIRNAVINGTRHIEFDRTQPLPTYLVAFTAGRFDIEPAECRGRRFRIFHLEPAPDRVRSNATEIARRHVHALDWLTAYTTIPYRFGKLDIIAIPSFQFTGMEHPGAIAYNADALLLDDAAPRAAHARRADVIAHETAHMWFGNLVTMPWFDDVWMKEVLASFVAARVVGADSEDDEALRFFVQHYPPAYDIDRTENALPIRQPLDTLDEAGLMYGPTLYHKAPIALRQLERLVGADVLRGALRSWLSRHAFDNAGWPELSAELQARTGVDVAAWSLAWIESAGRPTLSVRRDARSEAPLVIEQRDERGGGLIWPQDVDVASGTAAGVHRSDARFIGTDAAVAVGLTTEWTWVLPGGFGHAYGRVDLDDDSLEWLLEHAHTIDDARVRAAALLAMWDAVVDGRTSTTRLYRSHLEWLRVEADSTVQPLLNEQARRLFWQWMSGPERVDAAGPLETIVRTRLDSATSAPEKAMWLSTLQAVAIGPATIDGLLAILEGRAIVDGLSIDEADEVRLTVALALRRPEHARGLIARQIDRCRSGERRDYLRFVAPALSPDASERSAFSHSLRDPACRHRETWVIDALSCIHHPLRADESVPLILPALDLLSEVHRTGDIFYPQRWVKVVLGGHQSDEAAIAVRQFLESLPTGYSPRLRALVLTAADRLLRRQCHR